MIEQAKYMYGSDRYPILVNIQSRTWVTPTKTAKLIKKMVDNVLADTPIKRRVMDMTGNCGGNILPFLDDGRYSGIVYEIDKTVYDLLTTNMAHFDRGNDFVAINKSSLTDDQSYDVIIVDPPFGDEYKSGVMYQPTLDNINMAGIVEMLRSRCRYIFMKLPMCGFDIDGFRTGISSMPVSMTIYTPNDMKAMDGHLHKILLIVLKIEAGPSVV